MMLGNISMALCDIEGKPEPNGYQLKKPCGQLYRVGEPVKCEVSRYGVCRAIEKVKAMDKKIGEYEALRDKNAQA